MNDLEKQVKKFLERNEWEVIRNGWPDFLCVRETEFKAAVMAIEVKNSMDKLSENQILIHKILKKAGIAVYVIKPEHLKARKKLYGKLLWSSQNYQDYKWSIKRLSSEFKSQQQKLENLKKQLESLTIIFDETDKDKHEKKST